MLPIVALCLMIASSSVAAPVLESPKSCIERAEAALKSVEVPESITKLMGQLRELNPLLKSLSLFKFADSENADLRIVDTGLVTPSELGTIVNDCASFVMKAYPVGEDGEQVCDIAQYANDYNDYVAFLEEVAKHPDYDRKIGTAKICVQF